MPKLFSEKIFNIFGTPYFPLEDINEHGLSVSLLTASYSKSVEKENIITLSGSNLASIVGEAVKMIKSYNMKFSIPEFPSHFMISDATGLSVVVE